MPTDRIAQFKNDLTIDHLNEEQILHKHIIDIDAYIFLDKKNDEYYIRKLISDAFDVHINEVVMVGSAKIGFSISPLKLFQIIDSKFHKTKLVKDKSDIDIAIISPILFNDLRHRVLKFTDSLSRKWFDNEYYCQKKDLDYQFYKYCYKGWFRPDFKPNSFEICKNINYEELKYKVLKKTNRKLAIAIYDSWDSFKRYQIDNIKSLKLKLKSEVL